MSKLHVRLVYITRICLFPGINIVFLHIPGETSDHMGLWLPDKKVMVSADNIFMSFPNLYTIRGGSPRDATSWANSLYKMAALRPHYLIPGHTRPIVGEENINDIITTYANAIEFIHDQSVRFINKYVHPDEAATKLIKLPKGLAEHPYLQQFYGTVEWSVKGVYSQYLGWFSGDPVELHPLAPSDKARRMVELVGVKHLLESARAARATDDLQWALELASYVFKTQPSNLEARALRLDILKKLASTEISVNGRNYYMGSALDDHGKINWEMNVTNAVMSLPMRRILHFMKTSLKAEEADGAKMVVVLNFTDINTLYTLKLHNSVLRILEAEDLSAEADVVLTTTTSVWKQLMLKQLNPMSAYMYGDLIVQGSLWRLRQFMSYFGN